MATRPLSYSSLRAYLACPLRWKFRYLDGLTEAPSPAQALGRGLHAALEAQHRAGAASSAGALIERFDDVMRATAPDVSQPLLLRGRALLAAHHASERVRAGASPPARVVAVERPFRIDVEGVPFRGIVDLVEAPAGGGPVTVVDLKTGGPHLGPWSVRASRQLGFYQMGVEEGFGLPVGALALHNIAAGQRYEAPPRTRAQLDELRTLALNVQDGIDAQRFEPRLNPDCPCEHAQRCPFFKDRFPKIDDWTGEARARIADVVERYADQRERADAEALHAYMLDAGVRRAWGRLHVVDRVRSQQRAWDLAQAAEALGRSVVDAVGAQRALADPDTPPRTRNALARARKVVRESWSLRVRRLDAPIGVRRGPSHACQVVLPSEHT